MRKSQLEFISRMINDKISKNKAYLLAGLCGFLFPNLMKAVYKWIVRKHSQLQQQYLCTISVMIGIKKYHIVKAKPFLNPQTKEIKLNIIQDENGIVGDDPSETVNEVVRKVKECIKVGEKCHFLGLSCFGSLELHEKQKKFGFMNSTMKNTWRNVSLSLEQYPADKVVLETVGNCGALAELKFGQHCRSSQSLAYLQIGEKVEYGLVEHGKPVHGLTHPKANHMLMERHHSQKQDFFGTCPYHDNCLEGMISILAICERLGIEQKSIWNLPAEQQIWDIVGFYIAQFCYNVTITVSPTVIVLGGEIGICKHIYPYVHTWFTKFIGELYHHKAYQPDNLNEYIKASELKDSSLLGTMLLKFV